MKSKRSSFSQANPGMLYLCLLNQQLGVKSRRSSSRFKRQSTLPFKRRLGLMSRGFLATKGLWINHQKKRWILVRSLNCSKAIQPSFGMLRRISAIYIGILNLLRSCLRGRSRLYSAWVGKRLLNRLKLPSSRPLVGKRILFSNRFKSARQLRMSPSRLISFLGLHSLFLVGKRILSLDRFKSVS